MDKEWYLAELDAVMQKLITTQQMAILRGEQLIDANAEIMKLKRELFEARQQSR